MGQTDSRIQPQQINKNQNIYQQQQQQQQPQQQTPNSISNTNTLNQNQNNNNSNQIYTSYSVENQYKTDEIITIKHIDKKEHVDQESIMIQDIPNFFPLLTDEGENWNPVENSLSVSDLDYRGILNLCIDFQNYFKNSTGYINDKQQELNQKIRLVETRQARKINSILQIKTSDATHAQFAVKEVLDKVKVSLDKSNESILKICQTIQLLESVLPDDDDKFKS
ncbi:hypothetical protein DLAC_09483 [Tieghemostelium lacteum]|uniref:Uncharacterized protein n=1 Tax=Tieghemostelium lacteum TaxID=361077 RepID=A0A151Z6X3_TIELA|nr:hypothetical protein DLAC_09483 [Tieghemostelium lacteum]|eukprot:KYQ89534.1 hypothetical protein DLAC_09483 [Tieghemostelium lacteum]